MEKSRKTHGRGRIYLLLMVHMFVEEICIKTRRNKDSLPTILSQQERQLNFLRKKKKIILAVGAWKYRNLKSKEVRSATLQESVYIAEITERKLGVTPFVINGNRNN